MWFLPGEEEDDALQPQIATDVPGDFRGSQAVVGGGGGGGRVTPDLRKKALKFDTDYSHEVILNGPVADEEWPVKQPVLDLVHTYGCDFKRRNNLAVLSETEVVYVTGGLAVIHDIYTREQRFLQPSKGCTPKQVVVHPNREFIAISEKGLMAGVNIFQSSNLRLVVRFHCDGDKDIVFIHFNKEGSHLLTITPAPNYVLTVWDWQTETALCRGKASSNYPVSRAMFSNFQPGQIVSCGIDHIKFWTYQSNEVGWDLQCVTGKLGSRATSTIECFVMLALGSVISAAADGTVHKWVDGEIQAEVLRGVDGEHLHNGIVTNMLSCGRDLITMGTDGFVRVWKWDQLEGPNDNPDGLFLDVFIALDLGLTHVPVHMVVFSDKTSGGPAYWLITDEKGLIWRATLEPGEAQSSPVAICHTHCGAVTGLAVSEHDHLLATAGDDGNIRVYNDTSHECVALSVGLDLGATCVLWIRPNIAGDQQVLMVGYKNGSVRLYAMPPLPAPKIPQEDEDWDEATYFPLVVPILNEISSRTIQIAEIIELTLNEDHGFVASLAADSTLLLFSIQLPDAIPMSLYGIESPIHLSFRRIGDSLEMLALITTGRAIVYEVELPTDPRDDTLVDLIKLQDDPENAKKLTPITDLWHRMFQLKSIKSRLQTVEPSDLPPTDSRIVWADYDPRNVRNFWMSTLDSDSGYIYYCTFEQAEGPSEPLHALKIDPIMDLTVKFVQFLDDGHLLVVATTDGQVRILLLRQNFKLDTCISTWSFKLHDGWITGMRTSSDFTRLVTSGADGNTSVFDLLVPNTEDAITERKYFKEILATLQTTRMTDKEDREMTAFLKADRQMREQADREKDAMTEELENLRTEIRAVIAENQTLPCELRIAKEEFILHTDVSAAVEGDFSRRISEAQSYEITERFRGRIVEERLEEYFRGDLEQTAEFRLKSFDGKVHVSTYWIQKMDDDIGKRTEELKEKLTQQMDLATKTANRTEIVSEEESDTVVIAPFQEPDQGAQGDDVAGTGRAWERRRYADHLERARRRRQDWRDLLNRKPNLSEENDIFLQSEQTRISGQEYRVKQNEDHAIQFMADYLNAHQVELEFLALRQQVHRHKVQFNARLTDLRADKVCRIVKYREIQAELTKLREKFPIDLRKSLEDVSALDRDEEPEPFRRPTREECLKIFQESLDSQTVKEKPKPASFSGEPDDVSGLKVSEKKPRYARLQSFASRQTRGSLLGQLPIPEDQEEVTSWDELRYEVSHAERIEQQKQLSLRFYQQDQLITSAQNLLAIFDGKLKILRHDKYALDIELKRSDLHLLIYQWEHQVLNDYEDREHDLSREESKLLSRKAAIEKRLRMVEPDIRSLQRMLRLLHEREDRIRTEFETYLRTVLNQKRFKKLLLNIFHHKIKGSATARGSGDDEDQACVYKVDEPRPQQDCSVSSTELRSRAKSTRSSMRWKAKLRFSSRLRKRNSQISPNEFDPNDIFVCPHDLDKKVFQAVHLLNHQYQRVHREIEDELDRNREIMEVSYEAREELAFIEFELSSVSESLHELRLEKFNRWKDIPYPVAVRMSQFQFPEDAVKRSELYDALVFDERNLETLTAFIEQVKKETSHDTKQLSDLKDNYEKLEREQILFSLRIEELKKECRLIMMQKYGGIIDLDLADRVRVDPKIQEMQKMLKDNQRIQDGLLADLKEQAAKLKIDLTNTRAETTVFLKAIASQMHERDQLIKRTTKRANKIGRGVLANVTTEDLRSHQKKLVMWQTMAETQAAEIEALLTEISFFKRKDTEVGVLMNLLDRRYNPDGVSSSDPNRKETEKSMAEHPKESIPDETGYRVTTLPVFFEPPHDNTDNDLIPSGARSSSVPRPPGRSLETSEWLVSEQPIFSGARESTSVNHLSVDRTTVTYRPSELLISQPLLPHNPSISRSTGDSGTLNPQPVERTTVVYRPSELLVSQPPLTRNLSVPD